MKDTGISLRHLFKDTSKNAPGKDSEELYDLLEHLVNATKEINKRVRRAALGDVIGKTGSTNIQGEEVQKLDLVSNDILIEALKVCKSCIAVGSEENDHAVDTGNSGGKYAVAIDPLDGSSNIDVTAPIGTIFSVFAKKENARNADDHFLQSGDKQVAAGYVIYGSSTLLVFTTGNGVNGLTLDPETDTFYLTHPGMKIPEEGKIYSINEGNTPWFEEKITKFLEYCKIENKPSGRPYSARYIGSLVADFHRTLIKGGLFMYPATSKAPAGKLRLVYEGHPIAFLAEQAGGMAIDHQKRILDITADQLHQRTPLFTGSKQMVKEVSGFLVNLQNKS